MIAALLTQLFESYDIIRRYCHIFSNYTYIKQLTLLWNNVKTICVFLFQDNFSIVFSISCVFLQLCHVFDTHEGLQQIHVGFGCGLNIKDAGTGPKTRAKHQTSRGTSILYGRGEARPWRRIRKRCKDEGAEKQQDNWNIETFEHLWRARRKWEEVNRQVKGIQIGPRW